MLPFAERSKIVMVGRELIKRRKSELQFVWITEDISDTSKQEILSEFKHYPIVQCFTSDFIENCLNLRRTKIVAFKKSDLSRSMYRELKPWRINGNTQTV